MRRLARLAICLGMSWLSSFPILTIPLAIGVAADEREVARSLLEQLDDRRFTERKAAFLKLVDPRWEIDAWLEEQSRSSDPNRAASAQWIRRLRSVPGPIEDRLEMMADYQSISEGDLSIISKYIDNRRIESLVDMLEQLPESFRMELTYSSSENPFDGLISAAWRDGTERAIPRLLNAILPPHPIRVGLNARWKEIGMPPEWRVDIPVGVPEVEIASLHMAGRVDEALAAAKRLGLTEEYEQLLIRYQRWDKWLELDPMRKATAATGWGDVQRILLLECLGRHEEALVYYELRKSDQGKNKGIFNQQKALMALLVGDQATFEQLLQSEDDPSGWAELLFTHSDLTRLLEAEGLSELTVPSIDRWFDQWVKQGGPVSKPVRFQSLFHRLGLKELEEALFRHLCRRIHSGLGEQSYHEWNAVLLEWSRYGLDERRLEIIAELCSRKENERAGSDWTLTQRGLKPVQKDSFTETLETTFQRNFPNIRSAATVIYDSLRNRYPNMDAQARVAIVEDLNQGRMPADWTESDLISLIQDIVRLTRNDPSVRQPMLVDIADLLDTLGLTQKALNLLQDHAESYGAELQRAEYASKLGQIDDAIGLSLKLADRQRDDVSAYLLASQSLAEVRRLEPWLHLQKRSLSRLDLWKWMDSYSQINQRTQRAEPQEDVVFMLELLQRHAPSTWHDLWFGDAYKLYGDRILAEWYRRSIDQRPERIADFQRLAIQNAIQEIQSRAREQSSNPRQTGSATGLGDMDWSLWSRMYERVFAASFWRAVQEGNLDAADRLIRAAHRVYPEQINTLIDVIPMIRSQFGDETLKTWYEIHAAPMRNHLERFPNDTLIANNLAWLSAKCDSDLQRAHQLASRVVEHRPIDTYLDTLAEVEFMLGNTAKAIELSTRCRSMKPRDPHHGRQLERFRKATKKPSPQPG